MEFQLSVKHIQDQRKLVVNNETDELKKRKEVCLPLWLQLIESKIMEVANTVEIKDSKVTTLFAEFEFLIPSSVPDKLRRFNNSDFEMIKVAIENKDTLFSVIREKCHSFQCDCERKEGCHDCIIVSWTW